MSGFILPGDDVVGINERVRHGDPTVGWRGDPAMDVYLDDETGHVKVFAWDSLGHQYVAAEVDPFSSQGWRHELLRKLKDGDWQDPNMVSRKMAWMAQPQIDKDIAEAERVAEFAEKFAWGLKKDLGHHYGGTTRSVY